MEVRTAALEIEARLRALASADRAAAERRYLKSELTHLGAGVPATRRVVAAYVRSGRNLTRAEVRQLAAALWAAPVHERRLAAVELLRLRAGDLDVADLELVERFLREARTWALVDPLATGVAGEIVAREPRAVSYLDRWAGDHNLWLRRAALLAWLPALKRGAPLERFGDYADAMAAEKEFFIRKAIGWVLRDVSRSRPDEVYAWLLPRAPQLSTLTIKEAVKYLGEQRAAQIRARASRRA